MRLADILVTPLQQIEAEGGDVLHGMKQSDSGYTGFGEAYFSWVSAGAIGLEASYSYDDECGGAVRASKVCVSVRF